MNNLPTSSHASKKYIISAIFVGIAAFAAFFGVGMGAGSGIMNAVNKSNAASVSSASNMAFTTSTNGAKAGKVAKSIKTSTAKSSTSKSGKSVTTTTTSTTIPATTTTTTTCPPQTEIVLNGRDSSLSDLPVGIPDPVEGCRGCGGTVFLPDITCGCTIANAAITLGIDHPRVSDLAIFLLVGNTFVNLVRFPPSDASLVPGNLITFDDLTLAKDPQTIGDTDPIPADTYNAQGSLSPPSNPTYPDLVNGLEKFKGLNVSFRTKWRFEVKDTVANGDIGTIESVELTITCE